MIINSVNVGDNLKFSLFQRGKDMNKKIAVAGSGYVGFSISVLLAQHNSVHAVDIIRRKQRSRLECEQLIKQNDIQHVFIVGAKGVSKYGGYETFVDKLTEYYPSG